MIAREMKVDYLWIDSLCIIQDDLQDLENELINMANIYENSYFTIAATASSNSDGGCFRSIAPQDRELELKYAHHGSSQPFSIFFRREIPKLSPGFEVAEYPLMNRGWVFQEWALSSRMIHFCKKELIFDCRASQIPQSGENDFPLKENFEETRKGIWSGWTWANLVRAYSDLELSEMKDRLPAISALARRMCRDGGRYLAGLWENDLLQWLNWVVSTVRSRLPEPRAPSWSWASVSSGVHFPLYNHRDRDDFLVKIVKAEVTPLRSDIFGEIKSGLLVIEGKVTKSLLRWSSPASRTTSPSFTCQPSSFDMIFNLDFLTEVLDPATIRKKGLKIKSCPEDWFNFWPDTQFYLSERSPIEVYCLWYREKLWGDWVMILRSSSRDSNVFERIGILHIDVTGFMDEATTSVMTMKII